MSDSNTSISRRDFLGRFAVIGAAGLGASSLLAACGGGEQPADAPAETAPGAPAADGVVAAQCEGYDALTEQDLQTRQTLGYVDDSPNPQQLCSNCRFYTQPTGGSPCGGCTLFAGPVAPGGYCNSWAALAA